MVLTRSHLGCSDSVSLKQKAGTAGLRQRLLDRAQAMGWLECQEAVGQGQQCLGWEAVPSTRGTETPLGAPPLSCRHIHHSCEVTYDHTTCLGQQKGTTTARDFSVQNQFTILSNHVQGNVTCIWIQSFFKSWYSYPKAGQNLCSQFTL